MPRQRAEVRDSSGKKLAESADVVAGQGTLIGNPDSSLIFHTAGERCLVLGSF